MVRRKDLLKNQGVDGARLFCKPHDLQDFKAIIDKYGVDWIE